MAQAAARDWLLSRVLRRVALVNLGASPHGFANTYSHIDHDLIVESCCGTHPAKMKRLMSQSGMAVPPEDSLLEALEAPLPGTGEISLASRVGVTFRCLQDEEYTQGEDGYVAKPRHEWYSGC